jgi:hypothetical protein
MHILICMTNPAHQTPGMLLPSRTSSPYNAKPLTQTQCPLNAICHANTLAHPHLDLIIMKHEIDIPRPLRVVPHKVIIPFWPLLFRVARQHALQTDTNAFDIVYRRPSLSVEYVKADDAVGVDVWVPGYRVGVVADKCDFWGLWGYE